MKYTVIQALQVPTGTIVTISKEQADRRAGQLRNVKGNQHETLVPVWFKAGETVGMDEPPKHLLASLVEGSVKGKVEKSTVDEPVAMAQKAATVLASDEHSPIQQVDTDTLPAVKVSASRTE